MVYTTGFNSLIYELVTELSTENVGNFTVLKFNNFHVNLEILYLGISAIRHKYIGSFKYLSI